MKAHRRATGRRGRQRSVRVRFVYPSQGATISGATPLEAIDVNGADPRRVRRVQFQYELTGTSSPSPAATTASLSERHVIEGPPGEIDLSTTWDTSALSPGDYVVRVVVVDSAGHESSDARRVHVYAQPLVHMAATGCSGSGVTLDGSASTDSDGSIVRYHWDFGDGSPPIDAGPVVTHSYPTASSGFFGVSGFFPRLTVTDDHGATGAQTYGVYTDPGPFNCAPADTGCEPLSLDVVTGNETPPVAASWPNHIIKAAANKRKLGLVDDIKDLDKAANDKKFQVHWVFEVVGKLKPGSDPAKCMQGQRIQREHGVGAGVTTLSPQEGPKAADDPAGDPVGGPDVKCAPGNAKGDWCDDDYRQFETTEVATITPALEGKVSVYVADTSELHWLDAPGKLDLSKAQIEAGGLVYKANFEAAVTGSGKTAKCSFSVELKVSKTGQATGKLSDKKCTGPGA